MGNYYLCDACANEGASKDSCRCICKAVGEKVVLKVVISGGQRIADACLWFKGRGVERFAGPDREH